MFPKLAFGGRLWAAFLLSTLLATAALAGTNQGFTAAITSPTRIRDPEVGQTISVVLSAQNVTSAKQNRVDVKYDPAFIGNVAFAAGNLIPPRFIPLTAEPKIGDDGLATVGVSGAQLGAPTAGSGAGVLYTITFDVMDEIPVEGTFFSITLVQINLSSQDQDALEFAEGKFGVRLAPYFPNLIFDLEVVRRLNSALITWRSRFAGIRDTVRYRAVGAEEWQAAHNPLLDRTTLATLEALKTLNEAGINVQEAPPAAIAAALGRVTVPAAEIQSMRLLDQALRTRKHLVLLPGLLANTPYEFIARSIGLGRQVSPLFAGGFKTRLAPDARPVFITNLDIQPMRTQAVLRWFTNRPADTRVKVEKVDAAGAVLETVVEIAADEDGTLVHIALVENLESGVIYKATVNSQLLDADEQIADGVMTADQVADEKIRLFRTRKPRALRFIGPPLVVIGTEEVRIKVPLNQPASLTIDYGEVIGETAAQSSPVYTESVSSTQEVDRHEITLSGLESSTPYHYRITAALSDTSTAAAAKVAAVQPLNTLYRITTDPRGNQHWSRNFWFKTSAAGDTLPPVIVRGPQVIKRARVAVFRWATDVPTTGKIYFGTWQNGEGTLGTVDEWELVDQTPDGKPRFALKHIVTITGLEKGTGYGYRIEATAANGKSVVFDPLETGGSTAAAKPAKVLQPPGGAGSFITDNEPDTQFPVILSGPTVTSKTHDTAIVEWTTDEPANSEASFGTDQLDDEVSSGDNEVSHKVVISNLEPGTSYNYIVGSTDASGNGATESAQAVFTTNPELDLTAPAITVDPEVVYKNDESATIQWTTDEDATAEVEFGPASDLGFIRSLSTTGKVHEITLTNLEPGTDYFFKVSSTDLSNNGPTESSVLSFTTDAEADLTSPVLSDIVATPADSSVIIIWTSDELADSYVEFGTVQDLLEFNVGSTEDVLEHEITLTNLTPDTEYFFNIGSVDRANNQTESDVQSFTTLATADVTPPAVPTDLSRTIGSELTILSWTANTEADLAGYSIYRRTGDGEFAPIATRVAETTYTDPGLTNGTTYEYQITAVDREDNESDPSASVSVTPATSAAPSTPTELAAEGDDYLQPTLVFANATPVTGGATLTYTIQMSTESDFSDVTASISGLVEGSGDVGSGRTGWTIDRELEEGQAYYWRVRAVEGSLIGEFSDYEEFVAREPSALPGDFNGDNAVTFDDFFLFVDFFGQPATGDAAVYDLDSGGSVDFNDFFIFVDNFGQTAAGKLWAAAREIDTKAIFSLEALGGTRADDRQATVRVWADQVEQLKAFGLVLHYDPQAVAWQDANPGPGHLLTSRGGQAPLFEVMAQAPGELVLGNGITAGEPVSGRGLLAELRFRVVGSASDAYFDLQEAFVARSGTQVKRVQQLHSATLRPRTYYLSANFPNPFNPSTTIEYALPQAGSVELSVYDVLGRQVRTLVQDPQQAAGFYTAQWDGRDSAGRPAGSGVYFFRLQAGNFTRTQKMTLLK